MPAARPGTRSGADPRRAARARSWPAGSRSRRRCPPGRRRCRSEGRGRRTAWVSTASAGRPGSRRGGRGTVPSTPPVARSPTAGRCPAGCGGRTPARPGRARSTRRRAPGTGLRPGCPRPPVWRPVLVLKATTADGGPAGRAEGRRARHVDGVGPHGDALGEAGRYRHLSEDPGVAEGRRSAASTAPVDKAVQARAYGDESHQPAGHGLPGARHERLLSVGWGFVRPPTEGQRAGGVVARRLPVSGRSGCSSPCSWSAWGEKRSLATNRLRVSARESGSGLDRALKNGSS